MVDALRDILRWSHVFFGFVGLCAFWVPLIARKGRKLHNLAGRVFINCGYVVCASAALSCALITHSIFSRDLVAQNANSLAATAFLTYLAWVTFVSLPYAVGVLKTKQDPTQLNTPRFRFLAYSSVAASLLLIVFAVLFPTDWSKLLFGLSPIGIFTGLPMLRYMGGKVNSKREWFFEHMSATVGAGIAFHTAFAVFGARRFFDLSGTGWVAMLPWILPAALGIPALSLAKRHYRKQFGELPARKRPQKHAPNPPAGSVVEVGTSHGTA